jgi:imidazolonepropionase
MKILIKNIGELYQTRDNGIVRVQGSEMAFLPSIPNAWLEIEGEEITGYGRMNTCPLQDHYTEVIDADGRLVLPCWSDSHTHIVYPGSRELEFIDKIKGLSYEEIAKRGGGILNSARRLHNTSEEELLQSAYQRVLQMMNNGTGAIEIKSGYGLNTEDELKMLRVIRSLKMMVPVEIRANFLGAHAVPAEYKGRQTEYVDLIINEMLPRVAEEKLADFVDVFCDRGFFTVDDTERILEAAIKYGLVPKIHANELDYSGGIQAGVKYNALSVDHLEYTGEDEIKALLNSSTMATLLPGASFYLGIIYAPARRMIDSGLSIALASDFNPGSSPSGNMQFILSLACIKYKMTPEEAINAMTLNGSYALGIEKSHGSMTAGKKASFFITKAVSSLAYLPYSYGEDNIESVFIKGKKVK